MIEQENVEISEKENKISKPDLIMDASKDKKSINKSNSDEDTVVNSNLNLANIKKDLLRFEDEILRDLKIQQTKILEKDKVVNNNTIEQLEEFRKKIEKYSEKINSLSNMIITDKTIREKVELLLQFKDKNQELIMTNGIKLKNLDKDVYDNIYRIDSILKETVLCPKIIGGISKFKTFSDFMDYILSECSKNITFREKTAVDVNNLRNNDERVINNLTNKLEKAKKILTLQMDTFNKKFESKIDSLTDSFNDRITNYRIENMSYSENIKNATDSLFKQINGVIQAKNDIINKFDEKIKIINKDKLIMKKYFTEYKNEFNEMRKIFKEMLDTLNSKNINLNSGFQGKIKRLIRRQTMINKDIKSFETNINKKNNIIHSINMNEVFLNPPKISFDNNIQKETEKSDPPIKILKAFKRINTASVRINRFFEKDNILKEKKKKNEEMKTIKEKKHHKKIKFLNDIYLIYNTPNNIDIIKRKLNKFHSICVPNKKLRINLNGIIFNTNLNFKAKTLSISSSKKIINKKKINLISESIYNTSLSKSQNSLFSKNSEKSEEKKEDIIKIKYKTDLIVEETKELNISKTLDKESLDKVKYDKEKKGLNEDKIFINASKMQKNKFGNEKNNNKNNFKNPLLKEQERKEAKKSVGVNISGQPKSLNKIFITIDGSNKLEINPNLMQKNQDKKDIINNLKMINDNILGKPLSGYPKIVTNNGKNIIYSSRPIFKQSKFISYTNPNILALNHSINNLYERKKQMNRNRNMTEINTDNIFNLKQFKDNVKTSSVTMTERPKNVSFNFFKNSNLSNKLYLSKKKVIEQYDN